LLGLRRVELGSVPNHSVHDDGETARRAMRALRMLDRLAMAKEQFLSLLFARPTGQRRPLSLGKR
jgi:hypothetical protein